VGTKSLQKFAGKLQNIGKSITDEQRERKISAEQIKFNKIKTKVEDEDEDDDFVAIKEYRKSHDYKNRYKK